ncbi:hypothetical protein [Treponema sp. R6D11]
MKKTIVIISVALAIVLLCVIKMPTLNAKAIISNDYSKIYYNDEIYIQIKKELLPENVSFSKTKVRATVEGESILLSLFFLRSEYIYQTKYNNNFFIHLHSGVDIKDYYYCLLSYKNSVNK